MRPALLLLPLALFLGVFAGLRLAGRRTDGSEAALPAPVAAAGAPATGAASLPAPWKTSDRVVLEDPLRLHAGPAAEPAPEPRDDGAYRAETNRDIVHALDAAEPEVRGYHESGELHFAAQRSFIDGEWVLDGDWSSFYANGRPEERGAYQADVEVGRWEWWYENGEPMASGVFLHGQREGPWSFWYANGNPKMDATYKDGEGEGHWTLYHEDGFKWAEGEYSGGEISGVWSIWNADGTLNHERSGVYEHGAKVSD